MENLAITWKSVEGEDSIGLRRQAYEAYHGQTRGMKTHDDQAKGSLANDLSGSGNRGSSDRDEIEVLDLYTKTLGKDYGLQLSIRRRSRVHVRDSGRAEAAVDLLEKLPSRRQAKAWRGSIS